MYDDIPPYLLAQQQNPYYGPNGQYNNIAGYMTNPNMFYGPTYGQFGEYSQNLMPTPYGGAYLPPSINPHYASMVRHPFKGFFTYTIPLFKSPKAINPALFDNYFEELRLGTIEQGAAFTAGMAGTSIGASIGSSFGPVGTLVGGILGGIGGSMLASPLGHAIGRMIQIHETGNMLNLAEGNNVFGIGMSLRQSSELYKMFTKATVKDPNMSAEEYQLTFQQLAQNDLIDDSGSFSEAKDSIRKMKHVVEKLQDLFGNGDIKQIVSSLRQIKMSGVDIDDIGMVASRTALAATKLGQKPGDYINNTLGVANQYSSNTSFSVQGMIKFQNVLNTGVLGSDLTTPFKKYFQKGATSKDITQGIEKTVVGSFSEMQNPQVANLMRGTNVFTAQDYTAVAMEAGLQKYNKEHNTHYNVQDLMDRQDLSKEINKKYAPQAIQELIKKEHGNVGAIINDLTKKDSGFGNVFFNPLALSELVKTVKDPMSLIPGYTKYFLDNRKAVERLIQVAPQNFQNTRKLLAMLETNPNLFQQAVKTSNMRVDVEQEKERNKIYLSNHSMGATIDRLYGYVQYKLAKIASYTIPDSRISDATYHKASNETFGDYYETLKKLGGKDALSKNYAIGYAFDDRNFLKGLKLRMFGGKDAESQRLVGLAESKWSWTLDPQHIRDMWAIKRYAFAHYQQYKKNLEEFTLNPESESSQNFLTNTMGYFQSLKNNNTPFLDNEGDFTVKDKDGARIFRELTDNIKQLTEQMRKLASEGKLTKEQKAQFEAEIKKNQNSALELYRGDNYGLTGLLKHFGIDITKDNLQNVAKDLYNFKQNNSNEEWNRLIHTYAKMENISDEVAKHTFDIALQNRNNNNVLGEWAVKAAPLTLENNAPITFSGATGSWVTSGASKQFAHMFRDIGNANLIFKTLDILHEKDSKYSEYGNTDEGKKFISSLLLNSVGTGHLNERQRKEIIKFYTDLKNNWDTYTGGYGIEYTDKQGHKKYAKTFEDFMHLSDDQKKKALANLNASAFYLEAANRLVLDPSELTKSKEKAIRDVMANIFTYKAGKGFVLKGSESSVMEKLSKNEKLKGELKSLGFGTNTFSLHKMLEMLNGHKSTQLEETNNILKKIYEVLSKKKGKLSI